MERFRVTPANNTAQYTQPLQRSSIHEHGFEPRLPTFCVRYSRRLAKPRTQNFISFIVSLKRR
ncbi:solute carrier family 12 member 4-like isoform X1 [Vespula squamosa]|uniref:Solute carrier family 12 member 4-like isoform X1 n=1 Tax=Vespula squamosa TaxID=30214 RepID=A0ABD2B7N8_VESSQ